MQILSPGTRIGQYEIASLPMKGGMGVVYFALDHGNDGRPVALKTFRPELLPDRAARDRFLREGTAWIELGSHPHIVRCYKVEYIDPTAFLVLELIAKEQNMPDASLRSWLIPGQALPIEQALLFALQIARGMQHATEKIPGFVHRDLKPENILVGSDRLPNTNINRLRVTDFGLAAILKDEIEKKIKDDGSAKDAKRTQLTHGVVGTPLYMAPEQWKGEAVCVFTDIYAFGCILYEMLSGQHVADGKTITKLRASHCNGRLRAIPENLAQDIVTLLTKCLATDSSQRLGDWNELIDEVEHTYVNQSHVSAPRMLGSYELSYDEQMRIGWSYNAIGVAYQDVSKAEVAAGFFEKALLIAREVGDESGQGAALSNLGNSYADLGDAQQAIKYYEQALAIDRKLGDQWREGSTVGNLGLIYAALGDAQKAIGCYEHYLNIAREIGNYRGEGDALGNMANAYADLGDISMAIGYYEQQLAITLEIGDRRGQSAALGNLGIAYKDLGNGQKAIKYLEQALTIDREIGDQRGVGEDLGGLGLAYASLGNMGRAIEYYEMQLEIIRDIGDRQGEGLSLINLGNIYRKLGDARRAIEYFSKALTIDNEIGDRRGIGIALVNLGSAYQQLGDVQRAIDYYEQGLVITREIKEINGVATASFNMALLYAQNSEIAHALVLAKEAAQIWSQIGIPHAQQAQALVVQLQQVVGKED